MLEEMKQSDPDLVKAFMQWLLTPDAADMLEFHSQVVQKKDFLTHCLFVWEYFWQGGNVPTMRNDVNPPAKTFYWFNVLSNSMDAMGSKEFIQSFPQASVGPIARAVSSVLALNGNPRENLDAYVSKLRSLLAASCDHWSTVVELSTLKSLGDQLSQQWDTGNRVFQDAVTDFINRSRDQDGDSHTEVFDTATWDSPLPCPARTHHIGDRVSCFRPGTQVLTQSGSAKIEDIRPGAEIISRGGSDREFGICSDEINKMSTNRSDDSRGRIDLWGFNGGPEFFTEGHVFHTTAGLRAVNPAISAIKNPYLLVGKLGVGHSVLHTEDGKTYTPILIESIHSKRADCDFVYDVHMVDGKRTYHANGFLVRNSYPDITINSIAKALLTLPAKERVDALKSLQELKPLLARFGIATIEELLRQELRAMPKQPQFTKAPQSKQLQGIHHCVRAWSLKDEDEMQGLTFPHSLPDISLFEGVVYIQWDAKSIRPPTFTVY
ncbi:uncharacterized protein CDV56_103029 [Aspergillus thermomutatus]|uniref:Intein C-terminal splicing domain-containing protein n=1 Tax=Aspergillus thermomutatus TaxID=41047 RepID=A0A397FZS6_ASPTH|nr:uncharacterized protein CDV56_103029 [Aspergillus thermomutatus]RHZ44271.1 hypothetical protein CDV56_103029 [Aspergillus thermomutatus]